MKNEVELLSPAGNIESFKAACSSGADAIYMGLSKFNARVMAENFDEDMYIECIKYAHMIGIKVYLTLNTILFDDEIKDALNLVLKLYSHGLDAVIVQDIGIAVLIKKIIPNIHLHASTQMSVHSLEQLKYLEKIGFNRVVLARELTIDEIEYICKNTKLEIEVFVHGALCVSVSGQCLLSSQIGNRSANRGSCAQPCRMRYRLYDKSNKKILSKNTYILSKKDIYGLEMLKKLADVGVYSFKIEGRNKIPEYVSVVTSIYRKYLDKVKSGLDIIVDENDKLELTQIFNRNGLSKGYLNGVEYKESITEISPKNTGLYLGEVLDQNKLFIKVKIEEEIDMHDGIEIYSEENTFSNIVTCIKNDKNKIVNSKVKKGEIVWLGDISKNVIIGSKIYKTSSNKLNEKYRKVYMDKKSQNRRNIDVSVYAKKDEKVKAYLKKDETNVEVLIDYIPEIAKNKATSREQIIEAFSKTEDTAFEFNNINIKLDDNLFIPVSKLNELRRILVEAIEKSFEVNIDVSKIEKSIDKFLIEAKIINKNFKKNSNLKNSLFVYEYSSDFDYTKYYMKKYSKRLDVIYINVISFIKSKEQIISKYKGKTNIYVYIPNLVFDNLSKILTVEFLEDLINNGVNGFLVGNIGYIDKLIYLKNKYNIELIADYSLNISNTYSALFFQNQGFDYITPSVEINKSMLKEMLKYANIEVIDDYISVMSSRYCIVGSFVSNREKGNKCSMDCIKSKYILKDSYNEDYNLVFNNIDCTMNIVKKYENNQKIDENIRVRNSTI